VRRREDRSPPARQGLLEHAEGRSLDLEQPDRTASQHRYGLAEDLAQGREATPEERLPLSLGPGREDASEVGTRCAAGTWSEQEGRETEASSEPAQDADRKGAARPESERSQ
jgi:hypothetical protein